MATPLREDTQAATLVKSARLPVTSYTHTHAHSFLSLAAISICLPPLLSSAHPLSFSSSPCITLGIPHRPSPTITARSFHLITSHFQVKCKYVSSLFKPLWCLCLWLLFVSTHILSLSFSHASVLRDSKYICDWGCTSPLVVPSPIKGEIYKGNQSEGSLKGQL